MVSLSPGNEETGFLLRCYSKKLKERLVAKLRNHSSIELLKCVWESAASLLGLI